jgi:hypothetical protein
MLPKYSFDGTGTGTADITAQAYSLLLLMLVKPRFTVTLIQVFTYSSHASS